MSCQRTRELLEQYVFGDLDPPDAREVEEHLAGCPDCAEACSREQALSGLLRSVAARLRFPGEATGLSSLPPSAIRPSVNWARRSLVAACLVVAVLAGIFFSSTVGRQAARELMLAEDWGVVSRVNASCTRDGITFTARKVAADTKQTVVFFSVMRGDASFEVGLHPARVTLIDSWGRKYELLSSSSTAVPGGTGRRGVLNFQPLRPFAGKLRLVVEDLLGARGARGLWEVCFTAPRRARAQLFQIPVEEGQSVVDGVAVSVDSVTLATTHAAVSFVIQGDGLSLPAGGSAPRLRLLDARGDEVPLLGLSLAYAAGEIRGIAHFEPICHAERVTFTVASVPRLTQVSLRFGLVREGDRLECEPRRTEHCGYGVEVVGVTREDGLVTVKVCYTGSGFVEGAEWWLVDAQGRRCPPLCRQQLSEARSAGAELDAWPGLVEEVQFKTRLGAPEGAAVVLEGIIYGVPGPWVFHLDLGRTAHSVQT